LVIFLSPKPRNEARRQLVLAKAIPVSCAPSLQTQSQGLSSSYLVELSGCALSGQGLHRLKVIFITAQLQVILKHPEEKSECAVHIKKHFYKSSSDSSCKEHKILELQSDSCNSVKGAEGTKILSAN
jgi:hypothetical protein